MKNRPLILVFGGALIVAIVLGFVHMTNKKSDEATVRDAITETQKSLQ